MGEEHAKGSALCNAAGADGGWAVMPRCKQTRERTDAAFHASAATPVCSSLSGQEDSKAVLPLIRPSLKIHSARQRTAACCIRICCAHPRCLPTLCTAACCTPATDAAAAIATHRRRDTCSGGHLGQAPAGLLQPGGQGRPLKCWWVEASPRVNELPPEGAIQAAAALDLLEKLGCDVVAHQHAAWRRQL